ncbi:hypothetical protein EJ07DRAFT_138035 [Lizonia empirigonia]|nr:hypothetical protein EJ07DRAFT_138035 [Lizonia empirigonia]
MPIQPAFPLPPTPQHLPLASPSPSTTLFLAFLASPDPATQQSWCPDVRAALPHLQRVFGGLEAPVLGYVEVGLKDEWRDPRNVCRTVWGVRAVPTVVGFRRVGGAAREVGRLVEGECADEGKVRAFVAACEDAAVEG